MKTFSVKIPSGIRDGEKVRLLGQGKQGQNGGKNGDMFIKINIQNTANMLHFSQTHRQMEIGRAADRSRTLCRICIIVET